VHEANRKRNLLAAFFIPIYWFAYSSTVKMEATCSTETPVDFQLTTLRYTPENRHLLNHRCEELGSFVVETVIWRMWGIRGGGYEDFFLLRYTCFVVFFLGLFGAEFWKLRVAPKRHLIFNELTALYLWQKWVPEAETNVSGSRARPCVGLTTLSPSVSRLSRQCGIRNFSQTYRPVR
jgi:hypothetical protein